jgi:hypothetical protein
MKLTINQMVGLATRSIQSEPRSLLANSVLKDLGKLSRGLGHLGEIEVELEERVEPSEDFGKPSHAQSESEGATNDASITMIKDLLLK